MSDREKALDALQEILHVAGGVMPSHANKFIIDQSETIRKALSKLPEAPLTSEIHLICHYAPGRSIPLSEAKAWYSSGDQNCQSCGDRCQ